MYHVSYCKGTAFMALGQMSEILFIDLLTIILKIIIRFITQLVMDGISSKTENPHKDNRRKTIQN